MIDSQKKIIVYLVTDHTVTKAQAILVQKLFEDVSGPIQIIYITDKLETILDAEGDLMWLPTFEKLRRIRIDKDIADHDFLCLLTKTPNEHNWYVASELDFPKAFLEPLSDPNPYNFFVHFEEYSWLPNTSKGNIAAQFILKRILNSSLHTELDQYDSCFHKEKIGCLFDFCGDKADLKFRYRSAFICGDCLEHCERLEQSQALISQCVSLLEICRIESLPTQKYIRQSKSRFSAWPYPLAVTRHLYERSDQALNKLLRLIDHFDNLVRYTLISESVWHEEILNIPSSPSLGNLVSLLRELGQRLELNEIIQICKIIDRNEVVKIRNDYKGHGFTLQDHSKYEEPLRRLEKYLNDIEVILTPILSEKQLIMLNSITLDEDSIGYVLKGDLLIGSNKLFPSWSYTTEQDPRRLGVKSNKMLLVDSNRERFVSLHPFLVKEICSHCNMNHILINDGNLYIDLEQGHRAKLSKLT